MLKNRGLIFAGAALRACAVSLSGVVLALHLSALGLRAAAIGLAVSLGLAGCATGTWVAALCGDRVGRRAMLVGVSILMALGGVAFAVIRSTPVLFVAVLLGMVNGMGRDRGAGLTIEQAILPQFTTPAGRTTVFAWYNVAIDSGHAVGALLGGAPAVLRSLTGASTLASYQWTWALYSLLCVAAGLLAWALSPAVESRISIAKPALSSASRRVVARFAALSGLDSLGGGFLTTALLGYWFFVRFGVNESLLGPLFCIVRIANGLSHLGAAWLARRIGLVNTMVFTHVPSSLLLMTIPFAPTLSVAIVMFVVRESLVEMDVPTRQSYLVAVVGEEERLLAAGITNLTRGTAWAIAPMFAGSLMSRLSVSAPLVIGPGLKIAYDLLLYRAFRHVKPPEERLDAPPPQSVVSDQ